MPERVLEEQTQDARRNRPDNEQPPELGVRVGRVDPAVAQAAPEALHDPHPVTPEEAEEDERRGQVGRDKERDEVLVVLMDVPPEQFREDDAVAEAGDREELGHALEQAEDDRLPVGDKRREKHSGRRARPPRPALEPGEGEQGEPDEQRRDAVLDVMVARSGLVAREERGQRLGRLGPVDDRDHDQRNPDESGEDHEWTTVGAHSAGRYR